MSEDAAVEIFLTQSWMLVINYILSHLFWLML